MIAGHKTTLRRLLTSGTTTTTTGGIWNPAIKPTSKPVNTSRKPSQPFVAMHRNNRHCEVRGVWSVTEHELFIEAMTMYPCGPWRLISDHIGTRSIKQAQTHAQKYQQKLSRHQRGLIKRKTKLKRPEHRVDVSTLDQFTGHKTIVRYAQRLVKELEKDAEEATLLPDSPADATFVGFNLAGVTFEDWATMTRDTSADAELLNLVSDNDEQTTEENEEEFPQFDDMYDPPSDWNEWQLEALLQPTEINTTLETDKGGHPDGSELPLLEYTV